MPATQRARISVPQLARALVSRSAETLRLAPAHGFGRARTCLVRSAEAAPVTSQREGRSDADGVEIQRALHADVDPEEPADAVVHPPRAAEPSQRMPAPTFRRLRVRATTRKLIDGVAARVEPAHAAGAAVEE